MADNRAQIALAMHHNPAFHHQGEFDHDVQFHVAAVERNRLEINQLRDGYRNTFTHDQNRQLADAYFEARGRYVEEGLKPAMQALNEQDFYEAEQLLLQKVHPLYVTANQLGEELLEKLTAKADASFRQMQARNQGADQLFHFGVGLGILIITAFGAFFFYATVLPLQASIRILERITEGNLTAANAAVTGFGEPGRVMAAVVVMQVNLRVIIEEIRQRASAIRQQCQRLNQSMMIVAEHSGEQHDRLSMTLENIQRASADFANLTEESDTLALMTEQSELNIQTLLDKCQATAESPDQAPDERNTAFEAILQGNRELTRQAQELAGTVVLQAFSAEDNASQLAQVEALIVDNRTELQEVWGVSQHLEQAAAELDALVGNFELEKTDQESSS
jgi:methyl-accepting chemotaxis protein